MFTDLAWTRDENGELLSLYRDAALAAGWRPPRPYVGSKKTARQRRSVFTRDDFTCRDCGKRFEHSDPYMGEPIPGLELGHIIPRAHGGTKRVGNLIAQCRPCNSALGGCAWVDAAECAR